MEKVNLLDFDLTGLEQYFISIGEQKFRAKQVFRWMHLFGIDNFAAMTDIANSLKSKLTGCAYVGIPNLISENIASDGVVKWILDVGNNNKIETVFIPEVDRGTLCVSSQVGCALECKFCSTGRQGFNRNLQVSEILGQLWWANKRLGYTPRGEKLITNVVMMGMGEPLANYTNVIVAMKAMLDDNAYNLSKKKLTLSTSGMVPWIEKLKNDCPVSLAVSLHASNDTIRDLIIPLNKKYPINVLLQACKNYLTNSPKDFVTFEYVMLENINDKIEHAQELVVLMKNIKCKFNLIPFNQFPNSGFKSSNMKQILSFQRILQNNGYVATIRKTRGEDIDAACGQLVGRVIDKTKRQYRNNINIQSIN
jgi:23S rRNA (adenine2503-C2)-methyltransferase